MAERLYSLCTCIRSTSPNCLKSEKLKRFVRKSFRDLRDPPKTTAETVVRSPQKRAVTTELTALGCPSFCYCAEWALQHNIMCMTTEKTMDDSLAPSGSVKVVELPAKTLARQPNKRDYRPSYEFVFWLGYAVTTSLFIVDRLYWNSWARQSFSKTVSFATSGDSIPYKEGPPSVFAYDVIARISGRYTIAALNALYFTMMKTTHKYLAESWVNRLIDFSDETAPVRIHIWIGISICVLTIVHVWSIFFPVWFSGFGIQVLPGTFTWPLSEEKPMGFKDVNLSKRMMNLQVDDVYRLILMTILLGPIIWYSYRKMVSDYRIGIRIHQFVMLMYFIDIVRRHTHPHCWVLNVPVFLLWLADLTWGYFYRKQGEVEAKVINIGSDYIALFWQAREATIVRRKDGVGDLTHVRMHRNKAEMRANKKRLAAALPDPERKHPFTSMTRHGNSGRYTWVQADYEKYLEFKLQTDGLDSMKQLQAPALVKFMSETPLPDITEEPGWDRCIVMRTYTRRRALTRHLRPEYENLASPVASVPVSVGSEKDEDKIAMNESFDDEDIESGESLKHVDIWGPFHNGAITDLLKKHVDIVITGGGSGCSFVLDTLQYLTHHREELDAEWAVTCSKVDADAPAQKKAKILLVLSTGDLDLAKWFSVAAADILSSNVFPSCKDIALHVALTTSKDLRSLRGLTSAKEMLQLSWGTMKIGRMDFNALLSAHYGPPPDDAKTRLPLHIFCNGGIGIQGAVKDAALKAKGIYHNAQSFDNGAQGSAVGETLCTRITRWAQPIFGKASDNGGKTPERGSEGTSRSSPLGSYASFASENDDVEEKKGTE